VFLINLKWQRLNVPNLICSMHPTHTRSAKDGQLQICSAAVCARSIGFAAGIPRRDSPQMMDRFKFGNTGARTRRQQQQKHAAAAGKTNSSAGCASHLGPLQPVPIGKQQKQQQQQEPQQQQQQQQQKGARIKTTTVYKCIAMSCQWLLKINVCCQPMAGNKQ